MPPKSKKSAPVALKELNLADYVRKQTEIPTVGDFPTNPDVSSGVVLNIESLFPEWNIDGEAWGDSIDNIEEKAPPYLGAVTSAKVKTYLKLEPVEEVVADPKKGGKAAPKKDAGKKGKESFEFQDLEKDENGNTLPRICISSAVDLLNLSFQKELITSQKDLVEEPSSAAPLQSCKDIDRLMGSVYTLIARFAPAVISSINNRINAAEKESSQFPFLWNAIYPQTAAGVPCYNPVGRYCVKVFLGGKWRKVVCTDNVAVREDGLSAYCSSVNPIELWPMLLAKAVYAVFTACGYTEIVPDPTSETPIRVTTASSAMTTAAFVGFAVHTLTGWHPGRLWNAYALSMESPPSSLQTLMDEIQFGGVSIIPPEEIPGEIPIPSIVFNQNQFTGSNDTADVVEEETRNGSPLMLTKKLFKAEYRRRQQERAVLLEAIRKREDQIKRIQENVDKPFAESFVACYVDPITSQTRIFPILGISFDAENYDVLKTQLLTSWRITGVREDTDTAKLYTGDTGFTSTDTTGMKDPELANVNLPLPSSTVVQFGFLSLAELFANGGIIMGMDTLLRHNYRVALGWHWKAKAPPVEKDAGGKGKAAPKVPSKKGETAVTTTVDEVCQDAGNIPPILLALLPKSEEQLAIESQEDASSPNGPISRFISLSVMIYADLVRLVSADAGRPATADPSQPTSSPKTAASRSGSVVVVLQELCVSGEPAEPWVMRLELPEESILPMNRVTFHLPINSNEPQNASPKLYWVRIFTDASIYLNVCSTVSLAVGAAEDVWQKYGYQALVKEGNCPANSPNTEQLLFRIPVRYQHAVDAAAMVMLYIEDKSIPKSVSLVVLSNAAGQSSYCLPRLQGDSIELSDESRLLVGRCFNSDEGCLGVPCFRWKLVILSRTAQFHDPGPVAPVAPVEHRFAGAYTPNKRLLLFRDVITVNKNTFPIAMRISTRPLEKLKKKMEMNSVEKSLDSKSRPGKGDKSGKSSPAMIEMDTFSVAESIEPEGSLASLENFGIDFWEDLWIIVRVIRKTERTVVGEYRGRSIIQLYDVPVNEFLSGEVVEEKGGKDKKTAGAKSTKGAPVGDPVEFILEVCLDESAMHIPDAWRSIIPYDFMGSVLGGIVEGAGITPGVGSGVVELARSVQSPKFQWQLDFLSGSVMGISHDMYDLQRFLAMKNGWEADCEGRTGRAAAALTYYQVLNNISAGSPTKSRSASPSPADMTQSRPVIQESGNRRETLVNQFGIALNKPPADVAPRIELIETNPAYVEHVEESGVPTLYTADIIAANRAIRTEEESQNKTQCDNLVLQLQAFNTMMRDEMKIRVEQIISIANSNAYDLAQLWSGRERYRLDVNKKNESLKYLLQRAVEAQSILAEEEADRLAEASGQKRPPKSKDKGKKK